MNRKHNAGFSLVEVLIAIAVLGIIMIPTSTALVTFHRLNARTEEMFQAQLAVSSAVETLMAEGVENKTYSFENVTVEIKDDGKPYCEVKVTSSKEETKSVSVTTHIRKKGDGS